MSAHTPGPWFVQPGFLTIYNMSDGDVGLTCAVASVLKEQPGREAAEANARLIAAAPELLSALQNADAWIREMRVQHGLQATVTLEQNRAAIAKATGAQP